MKNGSYELVKAPDGYPGKRYRDKYVYEHQLVWWQNTGQIVPDNFVVHHINENKRDNRFENLKLQNRGEHSTEHNHERKQADVELTCKWCSKEFTKEARYYNGKVKLGQKYFFCSQSCQVRQQQKDLKKKHSGVAQKQSG